MKEDKAEKEQYKLQPEEQATTAAFKLLSNENESLKKSLVKTQDELEKMREEKFAQEKDNAILNHKQKNLFWIELFKFLSSAGFGFALGYLFSENCNYYFGFSVLVVSLCVFLTTLFYTNK